MRFRSIVAVAALAASLTLAGCVAPSTDSKAGSGGGDGATTEAGAKPTTPDDRIKEAVKKALAADPALSKETIEIDVKDGRVFLKGTVSTSEIKMKAEDTARNASPDVFGVDTGDLFAK